MPNNSELDADCRVDKVKIKSSLGFYAALHRFTNSRLVQFTTDVWNKM